MLWQVLNLSGEDWRKKTIILEMIGRNERTQQQQVRSMEFWLIVKSIKSNFQTDK